MWEWIIVIVFILLVWIKTKRRGYFWKAKDGRKLTFKQFLKSWKEGVEGITPLQQTKTSLLSYPLILGGIITGLIIMVVRREWWLVAILGGSLPLTLMSLLSLWQKFKQQKKIYNTMKELENQKENKK